VSGNIVLSERQLASALIEVEAERQQSDPGASCRAYDAEWLLRRFGRPM
jgi:hypothetical protein